MSNIRQDVLSNINIVEEIGNYVELVKNGQNHKCICPFHDDTNPSLVVSEEKQIFKCFVCGEGGTVIEFVQKYEKIPYDDALNKLAQKLGLEVKKVVKSTQNIILENINLFYQKILLNSDLGQEALKYVEMNRELTRDQINKFEIGYSPQYSSVLYEYIINYIKDNDISILELEKLNIFSEKNYDLLNGRVTFPIYDEKNNLVGFSGRTLTGEVKYLNSKQSEIFNKKEVLYNFNNIIKNNDKEIVIVEGFFDVITASKYNINNVVATMGVAFTDYHIELLKKFKIKDVYLGFDNDLAGNKTTNETAKLLIRNNFNIKIIMYGDKKDIDEFLNSDQVNNETLKSNALEYPLFILKGVDEKVLSIDEKSKIINEICHILKYYKNEAKKSLLANEVANRLNVSPDIILNQTVRDDKKFEKKIAFNRQDDTKSNDVDFALFDKEKVLFYLVANDYEKFIQIEEIIREGKFGFWLYLTDYEKLKQLYKNQSKIDYITLLDELEFYNDIDNEFRKYENVDLKSIDINKYINKQKKDRINKLKKLF